MNTIDLNCDMGEAYGSWIMGNDTELLNFVSSANIACGFHAGDPNTIDTTVRKAVSAGVAIGAHVSYPDIVGFGRRHIQVTSEQLICDVLYQLGALQAFCRRHGSEVKYVKAHGALYNDIAEDEMLARSLATAISSYDKSLKIMVLANSKAVEIIADAGLTVIPEAFADRGYTPSGKLVPRIEPGAVINQVEEVAKRGVKIAREETISDSLGNPIKISARSLCIHGDTPGAVELVEELRRQLIQASIEVRSFA